MPLTVSISDGSGSGKKATVTKEGAFSVIPHTHPPLEERVVSIPFRTFFTDSAGSSEPSYCWATFC